MGYEKGRLSRDQIVQAASSVVLSKGFGATTMGDLLEAAGMSAGKLTHHFPTKTDLFEAVFEELMTQFRTGPLARLSDTAMPPTRRIHNFFRAMFELYEAQPIPVGCPVGHAAGDSEGVSSSMRKGALDLLKETEKNFAKAFEDLGHSSTQARINAMIFVSAWQGAVVIARAGDGMEYIEQVFKGLQSRQLPSPVRHYTIRAPR